MLQSLTCKDGKQGNPDRKQGNPDKKKNKKNKKGEFRKSQKYKIERERRVLPSKAPAVVLQTR